MLLKRRQFLTAGAASATVISCASRVPGFLLQAAAASSEDSDERVLVVIQLTGGNDGLNTVVPYADDVYQKSRFATRISADQVLKVNDYLGFHPNLSGFSDLMDQGRLAVVQGVGYANPNRSHFESMDIWHTGSEINDARRTGWLGRYLDATHTSASQQSVPAVHFGSRSQPLALAGLRVHVPSIDSLDEFQLRGLKDDALAEAIQRAMDAPRAEANELVAYLQAASQSALSASRQVQQATAKRPASTKYPPSALARKLSDIALLVDAGMSTRVYYVTLDGFDTHSEQAEAHSVLLRELGDAVAAFVDDVRRRGHGSRVAVMAFSEFGRRVRENASRGTDHGAAAPVFVAGCGVAGGLIGDHPSMTDLEDGDVKYQVDFRRVYAAFLEDWLGAPSSEILPSGFEKMPLFEAGLS